MLNNQFVPVAHTPTPWEADLDEPDGLAPGCIPVGPCGANDPVLHIESWAESDAVAEAQANVQFVLAAVNNHDALVEALRELKAQVELMRSLADTVAKSYGEELAGVSNAIAALWNDPMSEALEAAETALKSITNGEADNGER